MFKRIGIIAPSVLALAGAVVLSVHLTHRYASAEVVYRVHIWDETFNEWLNGATVRFSFNGGPWEVPDELLDGTYEISRAEPPASNWWVWIVEPEAEGFQPPGNPCSRPATINEFTWTVFVQ